jgi:predicted DNA-binding transcriptional regulator YafY
MSKTFINIVNKLDHLICNENTGSAQDLARKMRLSTRCVYNYINIMRKNGAPIIYSRSRKSFIYQESGNFYFGFSQLTEVNSAINQ